jgi:hypothetical protein
MRGIKTILMIPAAAVLLLAGACTGNALDNGNSADVILEIISFTTPPVTAAINTAGFCSATTTIACTVDADCGLLGGVCLIGGCTLTVVDWTVALSNVPKNSLAAGPANDIAMIDVSITYGFPLGNPAPRVFGLGGQVITTGGTGSIAFQPIALQDLNAGLESSTGSLLMTFRGQTLEGSAVNLIVARDLSVEVCM